MTAPTLQGSLPKNGATLGNTSDIQLYFSAAVQAGAGFIEIRRTSDEALIEQFNVVTGEGSQGGSIKFNEVDVQTVIIPGTKKLRLIVDAGNDEDDFDFIYDAGSDPDIAGLLQNFSRATVVLETGVPLDTGIGYTIIVNNGAVEDYSGNGVLPATVDFTATDAPPVLVDHTPGSNGVADLQEDFVLEFNENVFQGPGTFKLYNVNAPNTILPTTVTFDDNKVYVNPTADLEPGAEYFLLIDPNAVRDAPSGNNYFAGIKNSNWFRFSTAEAGNDAPLLESTSISGEGEHEEGAHFRLHFSEDIQAGSGTIKFYQGAIDEAAEFSITLTPGMESSEEYEISGNTLKLNTAGWLLGNEQYTLVLPAGVVEDLGDPAAGMVAETRSFLVVDNDPEYLAGSFDDDDGMVDVDAEVYLYFSETLEAVEGGGYIRLYQEAGGEDIPVTSFNAYFGEDTDIIDESVRIDLEGYLVEGNSYYLVIEPDAVVDGNFNWLAGEDEVTTSTFTVFDGDPTLTGSWPDLHGSTPVLEVSEHIVLHFSEEVMLNALGEDPDSFIRLYMEDGAEDILVHEFLDDLDFGMYGEDFVLLNPPDPLLPDKEYYLLIGDATFEDYDSDGSFFAGFDSPDDFTFTTVDNVPALGPGYLYSPESGYTHYYSSNQGYVYLNFSEMIYPGDDGGTVSLYKVGDDASPVAELVVDEGAFILTEGDIDHYYYEYGLNNQVELYLWFGGLEQDTEYYLTISGDALQDETGNYFAGMDDDPDTSDQPGYRFWTGNIEPGYITGDFEVEGLDYQQGYVELVFSEAITLAPSGFIYLKKETSPGVFDVVQEFNLANSGIGVNGSGGNVHTAGETLVVTPGIPLDIDATYYIEAAAGLIEDLSGLAFAGFGNTGHPLTSLSFTTFNPVPALDQILTEGGSQIDVAANIELLFTESVFAFGEGSGFIRIKTVDGDVVVASFDPRNFVADDGTVTFEDDLVILNPDLDLALDTQYYVVIEADALEDSGGAGVAPILDDLHTFLATDLAPPLLGSTSPLDGNSIDLDDPIVLNFSEVVMAGDGQIRLVATSGPNQGDIVTFDIENGEVDGNGGIFEIDSTAVTITPTLDLEDGIGYYLYIEEGAITDLAGNPYAGLAVDDFTFFGFYLVQ